MLNSFRCPINLIFPGFEMSFNLNPSLTQTGTAAPLPTESTVALSARLRQKACGMCMTLKRPLIQLALSAAEDEAAGTEHSWHDKWSFLRDRDRFKFLTDSPGYTSHSGHPRLPNSHRSSSTGHTGPLSPSASAHLNAAKRHMWLTQGNIYQNKIFMCGGLWIGDTPPLPQCLSWMLILANCWISDVCVELNEVLWFFSHRRTLITETETTYSHGERSWDKGSCCHWGQRSWGGGPPHWLAAWASTGWPRSCSPRRWAVN